jgi:hypothetical protein
MKNEFVPYGLALKLKQLGFDEPCFGIWKDRKLISVGGHWGAGITHSMFGFEGDRFAPDEYRAPTFSQAFRWFREKYHIIGEPKYKGGLTTKTSWYDYIIYSNIDWEEDNKQYKTYEESELACLKKLIEIVTKQQEQ